MADNLTVRDIAERIRRSHEEMTTVIDRIRGWTDMGFLAGTGDKHPGRGARRTYKESAVIDAAVLTGLLDAGIPVVRANDLLDIDGAPILSNARVAVRAMQINPDATWWLVVFGRKPPAPVNSYSVYSHSGDSPTIQSDAQWSVVININVLFKDIQLGEVNGQH
jgi:hypothetical protein